MLQRQQSGSTFVLQTVASSVLLFFSVYSCRTNQNNRQARQAKSVESPVEKGMIFKKSSFIPRQFVNLISQITTRKTSGFKNMKITV